MKVAAKPVAVKPVSGQSSIQPQPFATSSGVEDSKLKAKKVASSPAAVTAKPSSVLSYCRSPIFAEHVTSREAGAAVVSMNAEQLARGKPLARKVVNPSEPAAKKARNDNGISLNNTVLVTESEIQKYYRVLQTIPGLSSQMTVQELKEEWIARGNPERGLAGKSKQWFLGQLGHGSPRVVVRNLYVNYRRSTQPFQVHSCPCHSCPLAETANLLLFNPKRPGEKNPRIRLSQCDVKVSPWLCKGNPCYVSCEDCDYDICRTCFELESMPRERKEREIHERINAMAAREAKLLKEDEERCRRHAKERSDIEEAAEAKRRAEFAEEFPHISAHVRNPALRHRDRSKALKFIIWKSCGYDNDGWHSYGGPPIKEFDSSFDNLDDANKRAEFLFFYDNPWGLGFNEMECDEDRVDEMGFRRLEVRPDDNERWTVGVVPSALFAFMDNAGCSDHESEEDEQESDESVYNKLAF